MSTQKFTEKQAKRKHLPRKPIIESQEPVEIQNSRNHKCVWEKDKRQTHPTLTSYVCRMPRCGRGKLIDEKTDNIKKY